jgi:hypothetical protein
MSAVAKGIKKFGLRRQLARETPARHEEPNHLFA